MSTPIIPPAASTAYAWNASERARVLADVLLTFEDEPESLSSADRQNLREWAERVYVATRRDGPWAMREAEARKAAATVIAMQHQVDAQNTDECGGRYLPEPHFEAGLRVYFAVLQGVYHDDTLETDPHVRNGWLKIDATTEYGGTIQSYYYCPTCAPAQRETEAKLGHALPKPWMECAESKHVRITDLRGDAAGLRCDRCNPVEID